MRFSPLPWRLGGALLALHLVPISASPSVDVALKAPFNSPPYLLELLETAAQENASSYFPLLDRIAAGTFAESSTDEQLYNTFLQVVQDDGHISDGETLSSFKLALSIRSVAPRIEAHYQYYNTSVEPSMMVAQDAVCPVWIYLDGKQYCSPGLERAQQDVHSKEGVRGLPFDRVLGGGASEDEVAILYADIMSPMFGEFHQAMSRRAKEGLNSYRLRYRPSMSPIDGQPLFVDGYGVELVLKRTDYIVIDDRQAENQDGNEQDTIKKTNEGLTEEAPEDLKPLSSSEVRDLGIKASSFILGHEDPFATLLKLSKDFPKHSSLIAGHNASQDFLDEFHKNRNVFLPAGYNIIWINGAQVDPRKVDAFSLLDQLRKERKLINSLKDLGLRATEAVTLISHSALAESQAEDEPQRYDWRDDVEGGGVVMWLNDLENDARYEGWPSELYNLVQRVYPGQLPTLRRDVHNVVLSIDFSNMTDVQIVVEKLQAFIKRKVPVRFALVPILKSPSAASQAKMVYHILETYGLSALFSYLEESHKTQKLLLPDKAAFKTTIKDRIVRGNREALSYEAVLNDESLENKLAKVQAYLARLSADGEVPVLLANGVAIPRDDNWLQGMSYRVNMDLQQLQRGVIEDAIPEETWIPQYFLFQASPRRNAMVVPEDATTIKFADLAKARLDHHDAFEDLPRIKASGESDKKIWAHLIVVGDFNTEDGLRLLAEAMEYAQTRPEVAVVILNNPASTKESQTWTQLKRLFHDTKLPDSEAIVALVRELQASADAQASDDKSPNEPSGSLANSLGFASGEKGVVFNGRIVGPIPESVSLNAEDFSLLTDYERSKRLGPLMTAITELGLEDRLTDQLTLAEISSIVATSGKSDVPEGIFETPQSIRIDRFKFWSSRYSSFSVSNSEDASIHVVAAIDPTTEVSQRWIPILKVLSELEGVNLRMYLNPREKIQEIPIKRFYRHVLSAKPMFTPAGSLIRPNASFKGIPTSALLTLGMDVPPSWLVAPSESIYDLDNIKLDTLSPGASIAAVYSLENILIEGHSRDTANNSPPRGVQLLLGTDKDTHAADTIIMANLGYFQFKANPGFWRISLKPGRSSKIFTLESVGGLGWSPVPGDLTTEVSLLSFQGVTLFPRLTRNPGYEDADVLETSAKPGSAGAYLSKGLDFASSALSSTGILRSSSEHADINIFSVASGHLYERMLAIMMRSVLAHTKHSVKFWFIEQFLSPSFKSFLPTLSAHYGFSYEMITYKWPHWLRSQTEKQREIWGYKILFLDVLFPLSLDKVIFVDADQIVRTDMYDLVQHDLKGAPYGFTPMCDSRTEMEGFRFWKTGYWKNFLRGLPYHISALYVVDLKMFREIAAGDRLRQQYHQLSADPASLSNLDQDLPNHMQMQLKIHSLPQDWLWCETWCSDEALSTAKTIDLCNNPLTKEPKLDRARRQVPEWTQYDDEISALRKEWEEGRMKDESMTEGQEEEPAKIRDEL